MRRSRGKLFFFVLITAIAIWIALGPGLAAYLAAQSSQFVSDMKASSGGHMLVESVSGDFWSGVTLNKVVIYADDDPDHLPILDAETVVLRFPLSCIASRDFTPNSIHITNFNIALHVDEDGTVALPEWAFKTAKACPSPILNAGFVSFAASGQVIAFSCDKGVLEVIKRFPQLTEPVDMSITKLAGSGQYSSDSGITIEALTGDYLGSPVSVKGQIPKSASKPFDLDAEFKELNLAELFKDIDPLFRGTKYLSTGAGAGKIHFGGPGDKLAITGEFDLKNGLLGNLTVDPAHLSVNYAPGIVELTKVTATAYGGGIEGKGHINLLSETPHWVIDCTFKDIDLGRYLVSNGYYAYEIKGGFEGSASAKGDFMSRNSLICQASINSKSGTYLSPFSEKFMAMAQKTKADAPIKESDIVNYDDATISLEIMDSRIKVSKYHFVSYDLNVDARGTVGFDKSIRVSGNLSVPLAKARLNKKLGRFVFLLPDSLSRANLEFTLSGSLSNVEFNAQPSANLIKGLLDQGSDLLHKAGDSFEGGTDPNPGN